MQLVKAAWVSINSSVITMCRKNSRCVFKEGHFVGLGCCNGPDIFITVNRTRLDLHVTRPQRDLRSLTQNINKKKSVIYCEFPCFCSVDRVSKTLSPMGYIWRT